MWSKFKSTTRIFFFSFFCDLRLHPILRRHIGHCLNSERKSKPSQHRSWLGIAIEWLHIFKTIYSRACRNMREWNCAIFLSTFQFYFVARVASILTTWCVSVCYATHIFRIGKFVIHGSTWWCVSVRCEIPLMYKRKNSFGRFSVYIMTPFHFVGHTHTHRTVLRVVGFNVTINPKIWMSFGWQLYAIAQDWLVVTQNFGSGVEQWTASSSVIFGSKAINCAKNGPKIST